jgi:hypothetical protein
MMHQVQLWGNGGYYVMEVDGQGNVGIPAGREAYERFAKYAPDNVVAQAVRALEAERDRRVKDREASREP